MWIIVLESHNELEKIEANQVGKLIVGYCIRSLRVKYIKWHKRLTFM